MRFSISFGCFDRRTVSFPMRSSVLVPVIRFTVASALVKISFMEWYKIVAIH